MSPVSRLFFSIEGDSSKLNASLREAIRTAEDAGVKITRAGEIFDAIVSRGKGAFRTLQDWIEGVFLSRLKTLFQNLVASIFAGSFGLSNVLAGVVPTGSWGNVLGDAGGLAQAVGGGEVEIPNAPAIASGGFGKANLLGGLSQAAPLLGLYGGAQGLSGLFTAWGSYATDLFLSLPPK